MTNALAAAEAALERGDYGQCIALLEPLAEATSNSDSQGAEIRMLLVTAWMGKGDESKALSTCRLLTRCKDPELRNRARQLLDVLEAPSLARPESWSMQLPTLEMDPSVGKRPKLLNRRKLPPPAAITSYRSNPSPSSRLRGAGHHRAGGANALVERLRTHHSRPQSPRTRQGGDGLDDRQPQWLKTSLAGRVQLRVEGDAAAFEHSELRQWAP